MHEKDIEKLLGKFSQLPRSAQAKVFVEMEKLVDRLLNAGKMVEENQSTDEKVRW